MIHLLNLNIGHPGRDKRNQNNPSHLIVVVFKHLQHVTVAVGSKKVIDIYMYVLHAVYIPFVLLSGGQEVITYGLKRCSSFIYPNLEAH